MRETTKPRRRAEQRLQRARPGAGARPACAGHPRARGHVQRPAGACATSSTTRPSSRALPSAAVDRHRPPATSGAATGRRSTSTPSQSAATARRLRHRRRATDRRLVSTRRRSRPPPSVGYPVVLKTAATGHRAQGRRRRRPARPAGTGATSPRRTPISPADSGPRSTVQPQLSRDVELALGIVNDPILGPLVLLAVGGTLVEVVQQRQVALPPLSAEQADAMIAPAPCRRDTARRRARPSGRSSARPSSLRWSACRSSRSSSATYSLPSTSTRCLCSSHGAVAVDALVQRRADQRVRLPLSDQTQRRGLVGDLGERQRDRVGLEPAAALLVEAVQAEVGGVDDVGAARRAPGRRRPCETPGPHIIPWPPADATTVPRDWLAAVQHRARGSAGGRACSRWSPPRPGAVRGRR